MAYETRLIIGTVHRDNNPDDDNWLKPIAIINIGATGIPEHHWLSLGKGRERVWFNTPWGEEIKIKDDAYEKPLREIPAKQVLEFLLKQHTKNNTMFAAIAFLKEIIYSYRGTQITCAIEGY